MPMHGLTPFFGKGASRLTGTTMVTAPGLQLRKWTPGSAQEYLWCPLTIRVTATLLDSVTLDHSTAMTRLASEHIKLVTELGLTPASRGKLSLPDGDDKKKCPVTSVK